MKFFQIISFLSFTCSCLIAQTIPSFDMNDPAINKKGKISFSSVEGFTFQNELAPVMLRKDTSQALIGFINKKGKLIIQPQFEDAESAGNGYFVVQRNGKYGLLSPTGEMLLGTQFKELKFQNKQTVLARKFYQWFIKDSLNKVIESLSADSLSVESDSVYRYFLNGQSFLARHKAKGYISFREPEKTSGNNNFPFITWDHKDKTAFENHDCNLIVPPVYDSVKYVASDSIFIVWWKGKIGILEKDGTEIMSLNNKYKRIYPFSSGRARMMKDGRYGFIDRYGNVRVSPQYENAQDFSEGYAAVFLTGKWGFIDKDEKLVVQPFYSEVRPFLHGTARVKEKNKWSFVNQEGKRINSSPYDEILPAGNKKWFIFNGLKYGLADSTGKEILAPKYEFIRDLNNGYVIVKRNNKWGVLDYQENFVIPIEYDRMGYDPFHNYFFAGSAVEEGLIDIAKPDGKSK